MLGMLTLTDIISQVLFDEKQNPLDMYSAVIKFITFVRTSRVLSAYSLMGVNIPNVKFGD